MSKKYEITLRPAYIWTCDECGRDQFERAIVAELSPEEREELREAGEDPATGNWLIGPETVKCAACGADFQAKHFNTEES